MRPDLAMFALVDYDPHGVAIMRTYKYGSQRLDHETNAATPQLLWLGIRSDDILLTVDTDCHESQDYSQSQPIHEAAGQDAAAHYLDGEQFYNNNNRQSTQLNSLFQTHRTRDVQSEPG
jgi:meiotic recombination protein SPO11